jgi:hypothetical protein
LRGARVSTSAADNMIEERAKTKVVALAGFDRNRFTRLLRWAMPSFLISDRHGMEQRDNE